MWSGCDSTPPPKFAEFAAQLESGGRPENMDMVPEVAPTYHAIPPSNAEEHDPIGYVTYESIVHMQGRNIPVPPPPPRRVTSAFQLGQSSSASSSAGTTYPMDVDPKPPSESSSKRKAESLPPPPKPPAKKSRDTS